MASRKKSGFLSDYSVDGAYLLKPARAAGRAGIIRATDKQSRNLLVKIWPRAKGVDDTDLEDIWRSEIRQLQHLAAVPQADDVLVNMITSGKDADGFYLILEAGQGAPLESFLLAAKKPNLFAQSRQPRYRRLLWANARRLAQSLELLHSQGMIHRNLDPWAVVTAAGEEPDFRLTGFEWSMRIATVAGHQRKKVQAPRVVSSFSFSHDWRDLALLFALFLDVPSAPLGDMSVIPSRVAEHASASEIRLLRIMLGLERVDRLDGEFVCARIDEIVTSITAEVSGRDARLCLAARLGAGSDLATAIRSASGNEIEMADQEQQLRFMEDDLGPQPGLVGIRDGDNPLRYVLVGSKLTYRLTPYRTPGSTEPGQWEFAYCERASAEPPHPATISGEAFIDSGMLEIVKNGEATGSFPRRRGKVQHWNTFLTKVADEKERKTDLDRMHQSFALLLLLEMAYAAANFFPVEVISKKPDDASDSHVIHVVSRSDRDRADLSKLLNLESPAVRLAKLLDGDEVREEGAWSLSEPGTLGDRSSPATSWRFAGSDELDTIECFKFEGTAPPPGPSIGFLTPEGMRGNIAQFKRRLKALSALRQHGELLRMLVDPRQRIDDSQDPLDEKSDSFRELDASKQAALREILSTIPLFLLQGPPGVGKTYLVGDVVRRRFDDESATRILLSAQSNSAIDHLMSEIQTIFRGESPDARPMMVRARSMDDDESASDFEIDVQAENLLQTLAASTLVADASPHLCERIRELADARAKGGGHRSGLDGLQGSRMSAELRAFEGMILRAANLVFATTNSYAVERLIEERGLFDWTIVEEAGKATGGELLSPLLLSHRRLMIGDHKQLPPFDFKKFKDLLAKTEDVKAVVELLDDFISRFLREPGIDDLFREVESGVDDFGRLCADTIDMLMLFETYVERELKRQKKTGGGRNIGRRLTEQYRMHPWIAHVVSECFYDGELTTNPKRKEKFLSSEAPFFSTDSKRLPDCPLTFIDMPYSRDEAPGGRSGDRAPPWSNTDEADAVAAALELLRVRDAETPASLAVLSPYWQQVRLLQHRLDRESDGRLRELRSFKPAIDETSYCGTVDSFQGGEADLVVISLVRNNGHSTPAKALGFLTDDRRMNVLLSRAKWRLVLVGSLAFYKKIVELSANVPDQKVGFLAKMIEVIEAAECRNEAKIVPWAQLKGVAP